MCVGYLIACGGCYGLLVDFGGFCVLTLLVFWRLQGFGVWVVFMVALVAVCCG